MFSSFLSDGYQQKVLVFIHVFKLLNIFPPTDSFKAPVYFALIVLILRGRIAEGIYCRAGNEV
jgi:hypothetical protein